MLPSIIKLCLYTSWIFSTEVPEDPCTGLPSPCTYSLQADWEMTEFPEGALPMADSIYDFTVPGVYVFEQIAWVELAIDSLNDDQSWEYTVSELTFEVKECKENRPLKARAVSFTEKQDSVVQKPVASVYLPNAFSPNGDGVNDVYEVNAPGCQVLSVNVYDRWGKLVSKEYPWTGTNADAGVYALKAALMCDGTAYVYHTDVTLTR